MINGRIKDRPAPLLPFRKKPLCLTNLNRGCIAALRPCFLAAGIQACRPIGMKKDSGFEPRRLRAFCKRVFLMSLFRSEDQFADSRCLHS